MPDRRFVYRVELDTSQAQSQARQLSQIFQQELRGGAGGGGGGGGIARQLLGAAGIGLGVAGGVALAREALDTAVALDKEGTALRRTQVAALQLAGSQEKLSALVRTYRETMGGAVTTGEAQAQLTKLMALGFADTTQELERFTRAARGAALATGNDLGREIEELNLAIANQSMRRLDQLGLSVTEVKKRIDELKISMPGLTDEARFQEAVVGTLIEKYGKVTTSTEAGATGLELLMTRFKQLREEVARGGGVIDTFFSRAATEIGGGTMQSMRPQLEAIARAAQRQRAGGRYDQPSSLENLGRPGGLYGGGSADIAKTNAELDRRNQAVQRLLDLSTKLTDAQQSGVTVSHVLTEQLTDLATETVRTGTMTAEMTAEVDRINEAFRLSSGGAIAYADAIRGVAVQAAAAAEALPKLTDAQIKQMNTMQQMAQFNLQIGATRRMQQTANIIGGQEQGLFDLRVRTSQYLIQEQERAAKDAASDAKKAWSGAADDVSKAWKDAAHDFSDALHQVPGLFGTSQVTAEQMQQAQYGIYQPQADEYLRQLRDEVLNKKDYENVDIFDAARRANIDAALPQEAILSIFSSQWQSGELFANASNLDLINKSAVQASLAQQQRSQAGQANIMQMFGLSPEGEFLPGYGQQLANQISGQMQDPTVTAAFNGVGSSMMQDVFDQWSADATTFPWADAILTTIYNDMSKHFADSAATPAPASGAVAP